MLALQKLDAGGVMFYQIYLELLTNKRMTKAEVELRGRDKLKAIEIFLKQMQVEVSAEQLITKDGFIKNIVYYNDIEKYVMDDPTDEYEKYIEETSPIREQDAPDSVRVRPSDVGSSEKAEPGTDGGNFCPSGKHPDSGTPHQGASKNIA